MELIVFGLNHKTAPVSVREKLALNENQVQLLDSLFVQDSDIEEAYILSTCNRTEFHLMVNE